MQARTIIKYVLMALVVIMMGALAGWYFFISSQAKQTATTDAARGDTTTSRSPSDPSLVSRVLGTIMGGGTGVSSPSNSPSFGQSPSAQGSSTSQISTTPDKRPPQLWQVQTKPVAGMSFVSSGSGEVLRYVERATGYVYEANPVTGTVTRIDNTLSPKVYEAELTKNGRIFQRALDDAGHISTLATQLYIATSSMSGASATSTRSASTTALAKDIAHLVTDPLSDNLFYLIRGDRGVTGFRSEWNGARAQQIFSSTIPNWNPTWLTDGSIVLTQAPASNLPGFAYKITPKGDVTPIVRGVSGLTLLPRAFGSLIFGEAGQAGLALYTQMSATSTPVKLSIKTIADKCAWIPDTTAQSTSTGKLIPKVVRTYIAYCGVPRGTLASDFLDSWYRGQTHTSDTIWRVDANAGNTLVVYNPDGGVQVDIEDPVFDSSGSYMAFTNKTDKSPWIFRVEK